MLTYCTVLKNKPETLYNAIRSVANHGEDQNLRLCAPIHSVCLWWE